MLENVHGWANVFYDVRTRCAAQLKKQAEWSVSVRRDSGWILVKPSSSLIHQLLCHNVQTEVSDGVGGFKEQCQGERGLPTARNLLASLNRLCIRHPLSLSLTLQTDKITSLFFNCLTIKGINFSPNLTLSLSSLGIQTTDAACFWRNVFIWICRSYKLILPYQQHVSGSVCVSITVT